MKTKIPWEHAPDWAVCVGQHFNGVWYWSSHQLALTDKTGTNTRYLTYTHPYPENPRTERVLIDGCAFTTEMEADKDRIVLRSCEHWWTRDRLEEVVCQR